MTAANNSLELNQLSFERNYQFLFQDLKLCLIAGDLLQIRGANGSGKSTLLRLLAGYIQTENNTVRWNNQCIARLGNEYQQQLHYLGHQNGVKLALTVAENLRLCIALNKQHNFSLVQSAAKKSGLSHLLQTPARHLSAGLLRRLALTRLLLNPLKLWILDEPATALDHKGQIWLSGLMREHQANGGIIIIATHQDLAGISKIQTLYLGKQND